ncbi:MAG: twin-arginine translocase TatA/TatE family subunit [Balneolaceae bacterium]
MGIGGMEWVLIALAILLLFGAKRIPELARGLGQGIKEFRKASDDIRKEIDRGQQEVRDATRMDSGERPKQSSPAGEYSEGHPPNAGPEKEISGEKEKQKPLRDQEKTGGTSGDFDPEADRAENKG